MEGFGEDLMQRVHAAQEETLIRKYEEVKHIADNGPDIELAYILRQCSIKYPERLKNTLKLCGYDIEIIMQQPRTEIKPLENAAELSYKAILHFDDIRIKISKVIINH